MANIKSAKKRAKTNEKSRICNVARRSDVKTAIKTFEDALAEKNIEGAKDLLRVAEAKISRATGKGIFKKNQASRKVSRLSKALARATK